MPYRVQKPYVIVNGQRLFSPGAVPQRMPVCDRCSELSAGSASRFTELPVDKWWNWFAYPKFSCQEEAFMGCEKHPVEPQIHFLDGSVERFIRLPQPRWRQWKWDVLMAVILAVVFAILVELVFKWVKR